MKKKQEEEEEAARRQEQQKRQMEALRRLQEQQLKSRITTWSQSNVTTGTNLADIQKLQEKEKKQVSGSEIKNPVSMVFRFSLTVTPTRQMQLIRDQQAVVQQIAHQNEIQQMQREAESRSNGFNLKWAEKIPKVNQNVKSLVEIQAEEQLQLAKVSDRKSKTERFSRGSYTNRNCSKWRRSEWEDSSSRGKLPFLRTRGFGQPSR